MKESINVRSFIILFFAYVGLIFILGGCSDLRGYSYDAHLGPGIDATIPGPVDRDIGPPLTKVDVDGKMCKGQLFKWDGGWQSTGINGGVNFLGNGEVYFYGDAYIEKGVRHNRLFYHTEKYKISNGMIVFDNYDKVRHMNFWSAKSANNELIGRLDTSNSYIWKLTCDSPLLPANKNVSNAKSSDNKPSGAETPMGMAGRP